MGLPPARKLMLPGLESNRLLSSACRVRVGNSFSALRKFKRASEPYNNVAMYGVPATLALVFEFAYSVVCSRTLSFGGGDPKMIAGNGQCARIPVGRNESECFVRGFSRRIRP